LASSWLEKVAEEDEEERTILKLYGFYSFKIIHLSLYGCSQIRKMLKLNLNSQLVAVELKNGLSQGFQKLRTMM
jgi:hypothetical protein